MCYSVGSVTHQGNITRTRYADQSEGWTGSPPKSPDNVTRIWDQKIGEMNKPKSPFDEDEDFIQPMSEGMKGVYRESSSQYSLWLSDEDRRAASYCVSFTILPGR